MKIRNDSKNTIHKPHDKALFLALRIHDVARDAMRIYLPKELLSLSSLINIRHYKTKLVSPQFKEFAADIIYEIELENQAGLILFHCEQQSTVDKQLPLRIWQYLLLVLMEYATNYPSKPLPIIYPIVLYTGEEVYHESTDLFDLFGNHKELAKNYLLNPIKLIDVCRMVDEDIQKHELFGLTEYAFKHKKTKHFEEFLEVILPWMHNIELMLGKDYATMIIKYVVDVFQNAKFDDLKMGTARYLSKELGDETMTIAQQLEQRGIQQGIQQGVLQGIEQGIMQEKIVIAKNMLLDGMTIQLVAKYAELPLHTVKQLQLEL